MQLHYVFVKFPIINEETHLLTTLTLIPGAINLIGRKLLFSPTLRRFRGTEFRVIKEPKNFKNPRRRRRSLSPPPHSKKSAACVCVCVCTPEFRFPSRAFFQKFKFHPVPSPPVQHLEQQPTESSFFFPIYIHTYTHTHARVLP